jgi:peptidoglycan-associated lipoprotein
MIAPRLPIAGMVLVLTLAACRREPPPPPAPTGPTAEELAQMRADSIARARSRQDSIAAANTAAERARAESERLAAAQRTMRTALEARIHFDYDRSEILSDSESVLREKLDILRVNPEVRLRIEGHADERGSTEYNLALGSRRAEGARQFLSGFGLDADRFATVSFGEERPLVSQSDEEAWAQNRRAEFIITDGGEELRPPS